MSVVKKSSAEILRDRLSDIARLSDPKHIESFPVLIEFAQRARIDPQIINFMRMTYRAGLESSISFDFEQTLRNGGFGTTKSAGSSNFADLKSLERSKNLEPILTKEAFEDFVASHKSAQRQLMIFASLMGLIKVGEREKHNPYHYHDRFEA